MRAEHFSLGEGNTPLIKAIRMPFYMNAQIELFFKNEGKNPNGSFIDRAVYKALGKRIGGGLEAVAAYSNGMLASSIAAYSSRAGVKSYIFVSENEFKKQQFSQALAFDSKIVVVKERKEIIEEMLFDLSSSYPTIEVLSHLDDNVREAFDDIQREIREKIAEPDYYFMKIESYFQFKNYISLLDEEKVRGVCDTKKYAVFDNIFYVTPQEIRETQNFIGKQEGLLVNKNLAAGIAGVIKADKEGMFKDGDRIVYIIDSIDNKPLTVRGQEHNIIRISNGISDIKEIMGLK